jgi:ABC-2 type transport system ATP-binding protein
MGARGRAALAAAVLAGLGAGAPAAHAADGYTVRTVHVAVDVGPKDDVRCDVVADLYRPDGADAQHPVPAILTTNGFGGSKDDQATFAKAYAKRGYAVLSYSGLGFGGSTCKITLDDRDTDGKAGSRLVTFLGGGAAAVDGTRVDFVRRDAVAHDGRRHDADPRVGMIGGSYGGQIQFAVAGIDPRVDTIVPQITWHDLSYSLAPNNTSFTRGVSTATPGSGKIFWAAGFFGLGVARGLAGAQDDPARLLPCPNFADAACLGLAQTTLLGGPDPATTAFLRHASVASFIEDIRIPTLLAQGQSDTLFNLQESVATYRALKAQGTPVKLVWRSAGHSGGSIPGENDASLTKPTYEGTTYREWLDHYLKDDPAAPSLDFTFLRDWVRYTGDATPAYGRAPSYPVGETVAQRLSGDGTLVADAAKVVQGAATFLTTAAGVGTSYSEISILDPGATPSDLPGTSAAWLGPPLGSDLDVVGVPTVDLRLSAPVHGLTSAAGTPGELVVFVRLEDVAPDGSRVLPRKLVSPVRIAQPDQAVRVELPGIVHRFAKGHRLRLVVYGGDLAYRGSNVAAPVQVLTDPERPGVLRLPVAREGVDYGAVVGAAVPGARKPCGGERTLRIRLARRFRGKVVSARVRQGRQTVGRFRRGRTTARISIRGKGVRPVTIRIVMSLKSGRTAVDTRKLEVCP